MVKVGSQKNEKGEEIVEWRKCIDPDHNGSADFYITKREEQFFNDKKFSMPNRCPQCRYRRRAEKGGGGFAGRAYEENL